MSEDLYGLKLLSNNGEEGKKELIKPLIVINIGDFLPR